MFLDDTAQALAELSRCGTVSSAVAQVTEVTSLPMPA